MQEYEEDAEFKWEDPKKVNKKDESLWRAITAPNKIEFFLLKRNQLHFGQSEHKKTPFTTESMKQKFDWNTSTAEAEEVLQGIYNDSEEELSEIMKLVLKNCVQIVPQNTNPEITIVQLREKMNV